MASPSTSNLKQLIEYQSKSERFEMFDGQGKLVLIAAQFVIKLLSEDNKIIESLKSLEESAIICWSYSHHSQQDRKFSESFWSFVEQLQAFLKVLNVTTTAKLNELIAAFIDMLLEIIQEILNLQPYFIHRVEDTMQKLKMELKFLVTFLGDTPSQPMELETTKKILVAIECFANEVGSFLYSFFFSKKRISMIEMKQKLVCLLGELEKLKESIKIHCVTISRILPNGTTAKTALVSPSLVSSVVDLLEDVMNSKDEKIVDLMHQIRTIHQDLMFLRSIPKDLDIQSHPEFEEFWAQIGDLAYEVEYSLESFSPEWYLTLRIRHIMEKIQFIKMWIQEKQIGKSNAQNFVKFVGMEDGVEKIRALLLGGTKRLQIVSIFGMPGLAKTAIAMEIHNDSYVLLYFDKHIWCTTSGIYQRRNLLIEMLTCQSHLNIEKLLEMKDDYLAENLYKSLKGRRYLIVIDNIQNLNVWDDIKHLFPDDRCGSRILFTSQSKDVAWRAAPMSLIHSLRFLNDDESWHLFLSKVFDRESCPPQLEKMGNKIATSCFGLPLAVLEVAKFLAHMPKIEALWMEIAGNINAYILEETGPLMEVSYNRLPMHLRPCFLYFGLFEREAEIPVQKLLMLWDAEGFIGKEERTSKENLAECYLMDLISRSMVLVAKR